MPTTFKGICDNYGQLHPQFAQAGAVFPYYRFGYTQKGNKKWLHHIDIFRQEVFLLGRVGSGIGVDISTMESESELESLEICHLRSPHYQNQNSIGRCQLMTT